MKHIIVLFGLVVAVASVSTDQSFNGTFEWMNDGIMAGSCGITYNTMFNQVALISDKWITSSPNDPLCKCNIKIDYNGKIVTAAIRGVSDDGQADKVEISYATYYALQPSADKGYNAVFTFVDCQP